MIAAFAIFIVILPALVLAANVFDTVWFSRRAGDSSAIDDGHRA